MMVESILVLLMGLVIGSFFNAFLWRFGRGESVLRSRSRCVHCRHELSALELIPVVSYLVLGGRCRWCKKTIPWHYPVVELATGLLLIPPLSIFGFSETFLAVSFLVLVLEVLFLIDLRYEVLPDEITVPGILLSGIVAYFLGQSFETALLGGILGAGFFAFQHFLSHGRWIGAGDIRLGALMGVTLGWQHLLVALLVAYILGALVSVFMVAGKWKTWQSHVPFGTFLTGATYLVLLWGDQLLNFYTSVTLGG